MVKLKEVLVVEGRYDKNTLSQIIDAPIFVTNGFGIFKDPELLDLLRKAAETRGLIVLTDSDGAGLVIRNHIKAAIPAVLIKHAYIPDVYGKERRKATPGKEGKLGVEGMEPGILLTALRNAGATFLEDEPHTDPAAGPLSERPHAAEPAVITKTDLYELGLSGRPDSKDKRKALQKEMGLPQNLSANALLTALNCIMNRKELFERMQAPILKSQTTTPENGALWAPLQKL